MIRDAVPADRAAIAAMLARAFADDPAMAYIFPDPRDRAKRLPKLFGLLFDADAPGMRLVTGDAEAATLWQRPGTPVAGTLDLLRRAVPLVTTLGFALPRALRVGDALDAHAPPERHWYLHIAGVDPAQQGKGLGGASIREGLARAAADGLPAYLETATERNVGLYQSLGFVVTSEWNVPKGGPKFWSMLRQPD
ncbi:N-acetyltransferase [Sphingomonas bacterium]|uniref:GNAT family N-acetyltransferase n=1 Tax=Sphingomonas bacterium TaxID=1895847 RepID=UPI00260315B6|nr:GNAT family N-acetyltransferase [Sphingomonas bacterium]MDB5680141.1 acetyltransferase [Sphingomonas bacterium]